MFPSLTTIVSDIICYAYYVYLSISLSLVATATLQQASYSVSEADGFVMICAQLTDGILERMITLSLSTSDGTALGKNLLLQDSNSNRLTAVLQPGKCPS